MAEPSLTSVRVFVDRDGDVWQQQPDGEWRCDQPMLKLALPQLTEEYGPLVELAPGRATGPVGVDHVMAAQRRSADQTLDLIRAFDALTSTIAQADGDPYLELERIQREAASYRAAMFGTSAT